MAHETQDADGEVDSRERLDEVLQELRVLLPGVELLFAFLLIVPFSGGFADLALQHKGTYFLAFMAAAVSSVLITAPGAMHRIEHGHEDVERLVVISTRMAIAGTVALAIAMLAVIFLITRLIFDLRWAVAATLALGSLIVWAWFALPLAARRRQGR